MLDAVDRAHLASATVAACEVDGHHDVYWYIGDLEQLRPLTVDGPRGDLKLTELVGRNTDARDAVRPVVNDEVGPTVGSVLEARGLLEGLRRL